MMRGLFVWVAVALIVFPAASLSEPISARIDSLKALRSQYRMQIATIDQTLDSLETAWELSILSVDTLTLYRVPIKSEGKLKPEPSVFTTEYELIPAGSVVAVCGYSDGYYHVTYNQRRGYMSKLYFPNRPELDDIISVGTIRWQLLQKQEQARADSITAAKLAHGNILREEEIAKERQEEKRQEAIKRERLTQSYGEQIAARIIGREVWLNMTKEMAIDSWGYPDDVKRTVNRSGVYEQWVYDSAYLYFTDGILTSWQD